MSADTLHIHNGDQLSGTLEMAAVGVVTFATEYAGTLTVETDSIRAVVTDEPVAVRLNDGDVFVGCLDEREGRQVIAFEQGHIVLDWHLIALVARDRQALVEAAASQAETEKKWSGKVDVGVSLRSGETDVLDGVAGVSLTRKGEDNTLTLKFGAGYNEVDSQLNTRQVSGAAKWQYYPRERLYLYTQSGIEHDPGSRLKLRAGGGGGLGYDVIRQERRALSLDLGLGYAREYWNRYSIRELDEVRDNEDQTRAAARAAFLAYLDDLRRKPLTQWTQADIAGAADLMRALDVDVSQRTRSEDRVYLQLGGEFKQTLFAASTLVEKLTLSPKIDAIGEFRAISDLSFETPLSDQLSLRINWLAEYDSDTGDGESLLTNAFVTSLRYAF